MAANDWKSQESKFMRQHNDKTCNMAHVRSIPDAKPLPAAAHSLLRSELLTGPALE